MKTATKSKKEKRAAGSTAGTGELTEFISLQDLLPNPYQPASRIEVDPETAKKFGLSIKEHGLIQTPVARRAKQDGKYEIGDGWLRRAGFAYLAGNIKDSPYSRMPCVVRELTDQQMADLVMEANTIRKDLNAIELALFYKRYLEDFQVPQTELAKRHNCSQGEIANTIRLLDLPTDIQSKIISQEISETHGRQLLRLNYNAKLQQEVLADTIKKGCSVTDLSNTIASKIYWSSANVDPSEYPKASFDIKECEGCPNRQKIGYPGSSDRKKWRCLDKTCYEKKENKAEEERMAAVREQIQAAKAAAPAQPQLKGKAKGKKDEVGVIDTAKMTWRDYQDLGQEYIKIDNPGQCKTCPNRPIGKFHGERLGPICIDVKCFKEKEKAYEAKKAAKDREAERQLTEQVKAVCDKVNDEAIIFKVVTDYLLAHSRKDTRERFTKMYGELDVASCFMLRDEAKIMQRLACFVLVKERYEGEKGLFNKMLAVLEGKTQEFEKQIADFREAHCKTCRNDNDKNGCRTLLRVYFERKCYLYSKKRAGKGEEELDEKVDRKSEDEQLKGLLPCKDCANAPTCDRTFFYADDDGDLACDNKVSAAAQEEVTDAV